MRSMNPLDKRPLIVTGLADIDFCTEFAPTGTQYRGIPTNVHQVQIDPALVSMMYRNMYKNRLFVHAAAVGRWRPRPELNRRPTA
jgi:hypothetical protein